MLSYLSAERHDCRVSGVVDYARWFKKASRFSCACLGSEMPR